MKNKYFKIKKNVLTFNSDVEELGFVSVPPSLHVMKIKSIVLPPKVQNVDMLKIREFKDAESVFVDESNPHIKSVDGVLFSKDMKTLIYYPRNKKDAEYTIPDTVTTIAHAAFAFCENLTKVNLSKNLELIDACVFDGCSNIKKMIIPEKVGVIEAYAFANCNSLENIELPSGLICISNNVFYNCNRLTEIVIPDSVIKVLDKAFINCVSLHTVELGKNVTSLNSGLFTDCKNLKKLTLGNDVQTIAPDAFKGCDLTNLKIYSCNSPIVLEWAKENHIKCVNTDTKMKEFLNNIADVGVSLN